MLNESLKKIVTNNKPIRKNSLYICTHRTIKECNGVILYLTLGIKL